MKSNHLKIRICCRLEETSTALDRPGLAAVVNLLAFVRFTDPNVLPKQAKLLNMYFTVRGV